MRFFILTDLEGTAGVYKLNGKEIGEMGLREYLTGHFDIPVLLVSGDDYACREAKEFIPDVEVKNNT